MTAMLAGALFIGAGLVLAARLGMLPILVPVAVATWRLALWAVYLVSVGAVLWLVGAVFLAAIAGGAS